MNKNPLQLTLEELMAQEILVCTIKSSNTSEVELFIEMEDGEGLECRIHPAAAEGFYELCKRYVSTYERNILRNQ